MGSPSPEIPFVSHLHPSLSLSGVTVTIASFIAGTPMYLDLSAFSFHVPLKQSSVISRFLHDLVHAGCGTGIARRPTHPPVLLRRKNTIVAIWKCSWQLLLSLSHAYISLIQLYSGGCRHNRSN